MKSPVHRLKPRRGVTLVSYGLLLGLISVLVLAALTASGQSVNALFAGVADTIEGVTTAQASPTPDCPAPAIASGSACLQHLAGPMDWSAARSACAGLGSGGDLASIADAGENALAHGLMASAGAWIGFNDISVEGSFVWADGRAITHTNWESGEPNNAAAGTEHCAQIRSSNGMWNDANCGGGFDALCRFAP